MKHNARLVSSIRKDNFLRPVLVGSSQACPVNVLTANFIVPTSTSPPETQFSSHMSPPGERKLIGPCQQDFPCNLNAQVQLPGAQMQPASEVSSSPPGCPTAMPSIDVNKLFVNLVAAGIITTTKSSNSQGTEADKKGEDKSKKVVDDEKIPPLDFTNTKALKCRYNGVINALYQGSQCTSCSMRFTKDQREEYRKHLDWHFEDNRRKKEKARKALSRNWFYRVEEWLHFKESEDPEKRVMFRLWRKFDQFWFDDEEEWHLRNAVRMENKTFHPVCSEDFKKEREVPEASTDVSNTDNK